MLPEQKPKHMLTRFFGICVLLLVMTQSAWGQAQDERGVYRIQLGVYRTNLNEKVLDYQDIMSKQDFAKLTSMGILRKMEIFMTGPSGDMDPGFHRMILGDYIDKASVLYVFRQVRSMGDRYPELGFSKAMITSHTYRWKGGSESWEQSQENPTRYTIQVSTMAKVNSDEYDRITDHFDNVLIQRVNGRYRMYVGIFSEKEGEKQKRMLSEIKALGYRDAFMHQLPKE